MICNHLPLILQAIYALLKVESKITFETFILHTYKFKMYNYHYYYSILNIKTDMFT